MDKNEQKEFINDLIGNVQKEILSKVDKYPNDWNGIELRWLIAEKFSGVVFGGYYDKRSTRYKNYKNTVLVDNLI